MSIEALSKTAFLARFGSLFEHSPWVVERAWTGQPIEDADALHRAFMAVIDQAAPDERLQLLRAHPQLADKTAIAEGLTDASAAEQASAGLDRLTPQEYETFHALNSAYSQRFGFPFIICVRLHDKAGILEAMRRRAAGDPAAELEEGLAQVGLISRLRLDQTLEAVEGLVALGQRVRRDLQILDIPGARWVRPRQGPGGEHVHDVVIVGGGQSGLGAAFALMKERVTNVLVLDENEPGLEGPWVTYARMVTLRTPKHLTGIDLGVPSLTFRSWWEAQVGAAGWDSLDKIPRQDWMAYLRWYRSVLDLPVRNGVRLERVEPAENGLHRLVVSGPNAPASGEIWARKVVLATGIQGGGEWHVPAMVRDALPPHLYAHTSQPIDYAALAGKRIGILGGGASAFDNAQHALSLGVAQAHVFLRRKVMPRVNPIRQMEVSGIIRHYAALDDGRKYSAMRHFLTHSQPPTNDTYERAAAWPGFRLHLGAPWLSLRRDGETVVVATPQGETEFDFVVLSTGLVTDMALRPELAAVKDDIALWGDRHQPPAGQAFALIDQHPYLGPGFELTGRTPQGAQRLHGLYVFNYAALASLGLSAAALSGLKVALPKLAASLSAQLFLDDQDVLVDDFLRYDEPEFLGQWRDN